MDWTLVSFGLAALWCGLLFLLGRAQSARRPDDTGASARLEGMIDMLAKGQSTLVDSLTDGQSKLAANLNDRLDSVSARLGASLEANKEATAGGLKPLPQRPAGER